MSIGALWQRRFTAVEFERMDEVCLFGEDERINLIDGMVYVGTTPTPLHCATVSRIHDALFWPFVVSDEALPAAQVQLNRALRLDQWNEPVADIVLVRYQDDYYQRAHPGPTDIFLVIEVMDDTASLDRGIKLPDYALGGVPETWLVDLAASTFEVYRDPIGATYRERLLISRGQSLAPEAFPDIAIPADSILRWSE